MKKLFILFLLILGCTSDEKFNDDVIHQTIDISLKELIGDEKTAFVDVGNIENGYFRNKLFEIKYDTLQQNKLLNKDLLKSLYQTINTDFNLNLSILENTGNLEYYRQGVNIDSLLSEGILVYELGYSKAQVQGNTALYYVELIDPSHRLTGAGFLLQLQKEKDNWNMNSKVKGWEMHSDTVRFFFE